ncbi:MAG: hypothetical protein H6625_10935 [Bdellovibrionaceae bacterium]|nr:hypothetical protein [Pseudobdellovibrionaceae bacterium]
MEPRLKTSKKWTHLPKELVTQVEVLLSENFPVQNKNGKFIFEGRIYPSELILRLGYLVNKSIKQDNFEVSIAYNAGKDNLVSLIHLAVDATASLFSNWAENPENIPPRDWLEFKFENNSLYARYSTVNTQLEIEADKLLGNRDEGLLTEEDEFDEELNHKISILGLNDDDDDGGQTH